MTTLKNRKFIELILYLVLISIFVSNLVLYNLKFQHDAQLHNYPIFHILNFDFDKISTPYGLFYYFYVSIFSVFSYPFYKFELLDPRTSFYLMVKISNFFLYFFCIFYCLKVSKQIFGKQNLNYFLPILLIFSMSSFHRSFLMAKPENLIILGSIISFYFLHKLFKKDHLSSKNFLILFLTLFFIGSAKLNGFYYVLCFFIFLLLFYKDNIQIFKLSLCVFSLIFFYYILHNEFSLMGIYDRPYGIDERKELGQIGLFNLNKNLSVFFNFSFIDSWNNPFRYSHSESMINALTLDLYGDYYGYGIFNYLRTSDGIWTENLKNCLISLNRSSLILSYIFFTLLSISIFYIIINIKKIIVENPLILFFACLFFSGIVFLVAFTIYEYGIKNSTYKWEYINFLILGTGYIISFFFLSTYKNKILKFFNIFSISLLIFFANYQLLQFRC